jgi:tRNA-dihydrouridine synthase B
LKIGDIYIKDPCVAFAPMEDVSDQSFRIICKRKGASLLFSEFVAADGIIRGVEKSLKKMDFAEEERPFGIQIFGSEEKSLLEAALYAEQQKPDFIDLNFGCPVKKIASKGAGSGMLKKPEKIIRICKTIVEALKTPVTVKTRLGYDEKSKIIVDLAEKLQDVGIKALTIHGRTKQQLYGGEADWTLIGKVKNNQRMHIPIIGNGDIDSPQKAKLAFDNYGVDGIMIGRAAIGNPWIFSQIREFLLHNKEIELPRIQERIAICREHLMASIALKGEIRGVNEMKRHYAPYFKAIPSIKTYRNDLVLASNVNEVESVLNRILEDYT